MNNVTGSAGVACIECVNPKKDRWKIRWNIQEQDDGTCSWVEETFDHKPTEEEIKEAVTGWHNDRTSEEILTGFEWDGNPVYLSAENQMNFKAAYDLAVQTDGATLPVKFKLGEDADGNPVYHTFEDLEEFADFYTKAVAFIQEALNEGWEEKDSIDYSSFVGDE